MKFICPLVTVSDMKKSREFYEKVLNQKVILDFGENITFQGDFSIHLNTHFEGLLGNKEIKHGGNNFELYFENDNIDEVESKLKEHGVEFIHPAREEPWKQKVVRFYDPDKNIIEIGESMEYVAYKLFTREMPIEEISKTTYMPVEFVKSSIEKFRNK